LDLIVKKGWDPIYGARPMKRFLEKSIVTEISRMVVSGNLKENNTLHISARKGEKFDFAVSENTVELSPNKKQRASN